MARRGNINLASGKEGSGETGPKVSFTIYLLCFFSDSELLEVPSLLVSRYPWHLAGLEEGQQSSDSLGSFEAWILEMTLGQEGVAGSGLLQNLEHSLFPGSVQASHAATEFRERGLDSERSMTRNYKSTPDDGAQFL